MNPKEQIQNKCKEVFAQAVALYPHLNFDNVRIRFDLKGRCVGFARRQGFVYSIQFNADMLTREAFDHVLNDTVSHEIAHIVCFMDPKLGRNHDTGWASVCRKLGGSGKRCHNEEVVYGKGNTYEYTSSTGFKIRVSQTIHRKVQNGASFVCRGRNNGTVHRNCEYAIVGVAGRTLVTPVIKQPTNIAATVERINAPAYVQQTTVVPATNKTKETVAANPVPGESKAATSRRIMLAGYQSGQSYETIITAMMLACGYNRQLARGTYKANAPKIGIPTE